MKKIIAVFLSFFVISILCTTTVFAESGVSAPTGVIIENGSDSGYSVEELNIIADEVKALMKTEKRITGVKVDEEIMLIIIGCEETPDPTWEKDLAKSLCDKYGNKISGAIVFSGKDLNAGVTYETGALSEGKSSKPDVWMPVMLCFGVIIVFCGVMFAIRHKPQPAFQTADGSVVVSGEKLSHKQIKNGIQKNEYKPDDDTFKKINDKINRTI